MKKHSLTNNFWPNLPIMWKTKNNFKMSKAVFVNILLMAQFIDAKNVHFYAYNNGRFANGREIRLKDISARSSQSLENVPITKILIHGFRNNHECSFPQELKDAYLKRGRGENIIVVDWAPLVNPSSLAARYVPILSYPSAVQNVKTAGRKVGKFIEVLVKKGKIPLRSIHIIGFSLGAHVAGNAGDYIMKKLKKPIGRITGLDPAGPLFGSLLGMYGRRLNNFDADFVDVVHTNGGDIGTKRQLGDIDFFVNGGGPSQPDCSSETCSHKSAFNYYIQSVRTNRIYGYKCDSYSAFRHGKCDGSENKIVFGDGALSESTEGKYYLDMNLIPLNGGYNC